MTITTIPVLRRLPLVLYPFALIFLLYITLDHANISTFLLPAETNTKNKSFYKKTTSRNSGVIIPSSTQNGDRQYPNHLFVSAVQVPVPTCNQTAFNLGEIDCLTYDPNEAHVPCSEVPYEFRSCYFVPGSCQRYAGRAYEPILETGVLNCTVNYGVDCVGETNFLEYNYPCMFRNGIHFTTVFITSVFAGLFGVDRFCLGNTCCGIVKLFTLGGIGVWWFIDLILLLAGVTRPDDGSSWESVY